MTDLQTELDSAPRPVSAAFVRHLRHIADKHRTNPVSWLTAQRIATRQGAATAREAARRGISPVALIGALARVTVEMDDALPVSGLAVWAKDKASWLIRLRPADSSERQRFTVLHEFKHIVDHPASAHLYDPRYLSGQAQAEMAADAFAAAALMPARTVRQLLTREHCTSVEAALRLGVTHDRLALRLSDLNLQAATNDLERSDPS